MTGRERLTRTLAGKLPDCVPVAPDMSNMMPAKRTGLPFWDLYLYQKVPIWKAFIQNAKYFDIDPLMDGYVPIDFDDIPHPSGDGIPRETAIVFENEERIVTRKYHRENGREIWSDKVDVFYVADPPTAGIDPEKIRLSKDAPKSWRPLEGVTQWPKGEALLKLAKAELGDQGLLGAYCGTTLLCPDVESIYDYFDDPEPFYERRDRLLDFFERKFHRLMSLETKPDFIAMGASGTLVFQTEAIFRALGLPILQRMTALCKAHGIASHVHSCGPEAKLVEIAVNETDLTVIDPLEIAPMGDCDLKKLKALYGDKIVLKGNLHTTDVMLFGTPDDVRKAARQAIDDAKENGRFILSTGDQCGRDTPEENIFAMVETARTYGKY